MNTEADDKFWGDNAIKLREYALLRLLTAGEAEEAAKTASSMPVTEEEVRRLVAAAVRGRSSVPCDEHSGEDEGTGFGWLEGVDTAEVEDGVLQLNRNRCEGGGGTDAAEDELRRRMLDDEEDDGGMEGGAGTTQPSGRGS